MPVWGWILIALGVLVVAGAVAWQVTAKRRTSRLQETFGTEYDRVSAQTESRKDAESELVERQERREQLNIRPLPEASRERYVVAWKDVQAQFVDEPIEAVQAADLLIQSVMEERGYPVEDFEQRAADVSVDHPEVVENYREGHRLAEATGNGGVSTEDLRRAMQHYRSLFEELVEPVSQQTAA